MQNEPQSRSTRSTKAISACQSSEAEACESSHDAYSLARSAPSRNLAGSELSTAFHAVQAASKWRGASVALQKMARARAAWAEGCIAIDLVK